MSRAVESATRCSAVRRAIGSRAPRWRPRPRCSWRPSGAWLSSSPKASHSRVPNSACRRDLLLVEPGRLGGDGRPRCGTARRPGAARPASRARRAGRPPASWATSSALARAGGQRGRGTGDRGVEVAEVAELARLSSSSRSRRPVGDPVVGRAHEAAAAATAPGLDQPLLAQHAERLADRHGGDAELMRPGRPRRAAARRRAAGRGRSRRSAGGRPARTGSSSPAVRTPPRSPRP